MSRLDAKLLFPILHENLRKQGLCIKYIEILMVTPQVSVTTWQISTHLKGSQLNLCQKTQKFTFC